MYNIKMFLKNVCEKIFFCALTFLTPLLMVHAAAVVTCDPGKICNPLRNQTDINGFIHNFLTGVIEIGIPIVALAVIYSGFLFVAARGNTEKLTKAKDALLYTLIGAAILLGSWAIAQLVSDTVASL